jgi:hypothetical protein
MKQPKNLIAKPAEPPSDFRNFDEKTTNVMYVSVIVDEHGQFLAKADHYEGIGDTIGDALTNLGMHIDEAIENVLE